LQALLGAGEVKILNLYAGIGGNRALWGGEHEVTAVENIEYIAEAYRKLYPNDTVIEADAHQYLLDHFKDFDFIWSSPPCPTHSKVNLSLQGYGIYRYPDMTLYQEIIFLKHFFKGKWLVENVISYYDPLISPSTTFDRHYFCPNFYIPQPTHARQFEGSVTNIQKEHLAKAYNIQLPAGTINQRKLLRNAVDPKLGLHVLKVALRETKQEALL
jgi:DNA (cytosine-5)-methyltransferase 1